MTYYYNKLSSQEQEKMDIIIDMYLAQGILIINKLEDLYLFIDDLVINQGLENFNNNGEYSPKL